MKLIYLNEEKTSMLCLGQGVYKPSASKIRELAHDRCAVAVTDKNIRALWYERLADSWNTDDFFMNEVITDSKDSDTLASFCSECAQDKEILLIAFGGCSVQKIADEAAELLGQRCKTIRVLTTPVSVLRYSLEREPLLVLCDTDFFATLDETQSEASVAEIIRMSICLDDRILFKLYETPDYISILAPLVCSARDMKKQSMQDLLDFALHEAQALMTIDEQTLTLPQAVAIACVMLAHASSRSGICRHSFEKELRSLLTYLGFPCDFLCTAEEFIKAMIPYAKDGKLTLVMCRRLGQCVKHTVSLDEIGKLFDLAESI